MSGSDVGGLAEWVRLAEWLNWGLRIQNRDPENACD
jgi:hypothetical protein